jgi:uncharacterized protein (TIGR02145 family)
MKKIKILSLPACLVLAMALTFSCSSDDDEGGGGGDGNPSNSGGYTGSYGSVSYSGKTYKTIKIGTQTWFAENLNYAVAGSKCYDNDPANCVKYGRLYDWSTAMALPSSCNESDCLVGQIQPKRGICPSGWHIPSYAEWNVLVTAAGGSSTAGTKLKATSGWNSGRNGTDEYGFSALPGGGGYYSGGSFSGVGAYGRWWSATEEYNGEYNALIAYNRRMHYSNSGVGTDIDDKAYLFSVRCVQD